MHSEWSHSGFPFPLFPCALLAMGKLRASTGTCRCQDGFLIPASDPSKALGIRSRLKLQHGDGGGDTGRKGMPRASSVVPGLYLNPGLSMSSRCSSCSLPLQDLLLNQVEAGTAPGWRQELTSDGYPTALPPDNHWMRTQHCQKQKDTSQGTCSHERQSQSWARAGISLPIPTPFFSPCKETGAEKQNTPERFRVQRGFICMNDYETSVRKRSRMEINSKTATLTNFSPISLFCLTHFVYK